MVTPNAQTPDAAAATWLEGLMADVATALVDLDTLHGLVVDLEDTRIRGLGFLTADAAQAQDKLVREERRLRIWNAANRHPAPAGDTPAPGNLIAFQLDAEIHFATRHLIRRVTKALYAAGVCSTSRHPGAEATTSQLIGHLAGLVRGAPSPSLLEEVLTEVSVLVERAQRLVDGNDKALHPDPCPHCGRQTLVVYFADGVIRCDRDPKSGHFHPCICGDDYCACKRKPVSHRHAWHRALGTGPGSWWSLSDRLNRNRVTN